jgi:hypothetical protein
MYTTTPGTVEGEKITMPANCLKSIFTSGWSKTSGCKACEILRNEAYVVIRCNDTPLHPLAKGGMKGGSAIGNERYPDAWRDRWVFFISLQVRGWGEFYSGVQKGPDLPNFFNNKNISDA